MSIVGKAFLLSDLFIRQEYKYDYVTGLCYCALYVRGPSECECVYRCALLFIVHELSKYVYMCTAVLYIWTECVYRSVLLYIVHGLSVYVYVYKCALLYIGRVCMNIIQVLRHCTLYMGRASMSKCWCNCI